MVRERKAITNYCIHVRGYFYEFHKSDLVKISTSIYVYLIFFSHENISKIMKLSPREFLHLVQNRENICT